MAEIRRYFLTLSYDGTRYHGWQIQPNGNSVQQTLEEALGRLLRHPVTVTGAGRTDAGVHARKMVAHFDWRPAGNDLPPLLKDTDQLVYKLNRLLPHDIAIQQAREVDPSLHARFSATSRTYRYYIHTQKSPFLCQYSCELHYQLDFALMNEAANIIMEYEDFGAFCKAHTDVKTTLCHITRAEWIQTTDCQWHFVITANRFLRNMVRAVVGTLVEVGRHRMTLSQLRSVIEGRDRSNAGESMPAHALFLEDVSYEIDEVVSL